MSPRQIVLLAIATVTMVMAAITIAITITIIISRPKIFGPRRHAWIRLLRSLRS